MCRARPARAYSPILHAGLPVHGDDFTSTGEKRELYWLESMLEARYELRNDRRLGPGDDDVKELTVLNRML